MPTESVEEYKGRYTILKWNGKEGMSTKFIIVDNNTGKQAVLIPGRVQDIVWTRMELNKDPGIKLWEDFENESVDDLEDIVF